MKLRDPSQWMKEDEYRIYEGRRSSVVHCGYELEHAKKWEVGTHTRRIPRDFFGAIAHQDRRQFHADGSGALEWVYGKKKRGGYYRTPGWILRNFLNESYYLHSDAGDIGYTWKWQHDADYEGYHCSHGCHWHFQPTEYAKDREGFGSAWAIVYNTLVDLTPIFLPFMIHGDEDGAMRCRRDKEDYNQWFFHTVDTRVSAATAREEVENRLNEIETHRDNRLEITWNPPKSHMLYYKLPEHEDWSGPWTNVPGSYRMNWQMPQSMEEKQAKKEDVTVEVRVPEAHPAMAATGMRILQRIMNRSIDRGWSPKIVRGRSAISDTIDRVAHYEDVYDVLTDESYGPIKFATQNTSRGETVRGIPILGKRKEFDTLWEILDAYIDKEYRAALNKYADRCMWLIKQQGVPAENDRALWEVMDKNFAWEHPYKQLKSPRY